MRLCASARFEWYVKRISTPRRARLMAVLRPSPRLPPVMTAVVWFPLLLVSSLIALDQRTLPVNDAFLMLEQLQANDLGRCSRCRVAEIFRSDMRPGRIT